MDRQTSNPQFQNPTSWDPKVNFSKNMGSHSLKMGYEYLQIHTEILDTNPLYGQDTYNGRFSKPTCAQLGQACGLLDRRAIRPAYNLADFSSALPAIITLGSYAVVNLRQFLHSLYFQDDYRVTPKLTVNIGLRWEFASRRSMSATTTTRISTPLPTPWSKPPAEASITAAWCIPITKTTGRASAWHTASIPRR